MTFSPDAMPGSGIPHILIVYSDPDDGARLRLDREHRAIDEVLERRRIDARFVRRLHAATVQDFARALRDEDYQVVQFSGHGSPAGVFLDEAGVREGRLVGPDKIAGMLKASLPRLRVAMFLACFSSDQLDLLKDSATYLVMLRGTAGDEACVRFVTHFYDCFFVYNAVEPAFKNALAAVEAEGHADDVKPVLFRRRATGEESALLVHVFFGNRADSVLVDLSAAEQDIASLDVSRSDFLDLLGRKIRLHRWVFALPREKALLSIGRYVGEFSWHDARDIVVCHRVLQFGDDIPQDVYDLWGDLVVSYNDLCTQRYRAVSTPADPLNDRLVRQAVEEYDRFFRYYFEGSKSAVMLRSVASEQFKVTRTTLHANLRQADVCFGRGDIGKVVAHLEVGLSSIHDLVREFTETLRLGGKRPSRS